MSLSVTIDTREVEERIVERLRQELPSIINEATNPKKDPDEWLEYSQVMQEIRLGRTSSDALLELGLLPRCDLRMGSKRIWLRRTVEAFKRQVEKDGYLELIRPDTKKPRAT